jgi:hypothetical protein
VVLPSILEVQYTFEGNSGDAFAGLSERLVAFADFAADLECFLVLKLVLPLKGFHYLLWY